MRLVLRGADLKGGKKPLDVVARAVVGLELGVSVYVSLYLERCKGGNVVTVSVDDGSKGDLSIRTPFSVVSDVC